MRSTFKVLFYVNGSKEKNGIVPIMGRVTINSNVTMERAITTINESGRVNIPNGNVWMSEMELVELFGVIAPTLRAAIKAIYKRKKVLESVSQRKEKGINLFFVLKDDGNDKYYHTELNN
jgi:hypothetical protein